MKRFLIASLALAFVGCATGFTSLSLSDDLAVGDDATITDDLAVTGLATVGETLGVTGIATFSAGATIVSPAILLDEIRFCGNGNNGATATHMGPVATGADATFVTGGAGCDGLDNATIGTVDDAWPQSPNVAFKPVAMVCNGICTGASAANDVMVFALYDDTAAVAGMTCTFTFGGDATANQCTVTDSTPATVAAGSLMAVKVTGVDDACEAGGDDFECTLLVTY